MLRHVLPALLALGVVWLGPERAFAQTEQQTLVDRATLSVQEMLTAPDSGDRAWAMKRARAVMICPRVFRASFIVGGAGGDCVLAARDGNGSWSSPAFFQLSTASVGLQIGLQDSEILMTILTEKGLNAVMDSRFKIGGDASVAFAQMGAGVEGATTAALRADILAFSQSSGLFAGISLNGSLLAAKSEWDRAYYGRDIGAREIVVDMKVNNPGADPLRTILAKYGAQSSAPPAEATLPTPPPEAPATPQASGGAPQSLAPVQSQDLAPPKN
jgi:lipid-binding SYLF domain-containing protein